MTRDDFVPAGDLEYGEQVVTIDGQLWHLTTITPRAGPETVYNFEVANQHVYYVSQNGLLVHNASKGIYLTKKQDDLVTVWHFTDKKGKNAIASAKRIRIKASTPPAPNPKGAYFSKVSPEKLGRNASKNLRIPKNKLEYVFEVKVPRSILKDKGGSHRYIAYSIDDVLVDFGNWTVKAFK